MAKKRPFYKKFRRTLYETVSDSGNSVLRYRGHDDKEHYVASSEAPDIEPGGGGMVEVKWQELKNKRDNGQLIAGSLYRITDYNCTTTQENTRSAGHQFDIVLLALSENKLAEEGWAMEHPTDVYDVTFADGVTKKCYIYITYDDGEAKNCNAVDIETMLGCGSMSIGERGDIDVNFEQKTAYCYGDSSDMTEENLTYNYFQNSNLSAWKVWYCLDNDKNRFAWADDSVDEGEPAKIQTNGVRGYTFSTDATFIRDEQYDEIEERSGKTFYAWVKDDDNSRIVYTHSNPPLVGEEHYLYIKSSRNFVQANGNTVDYYTPPTQGTGLPNGRGVIYRLIDEWGNDVPYDFKNIQFVRPMHVGEYDPDGENTWCYTFSYYDSNSNDIIDSSLGIRFDGEEDDYTMEYSKLNVIKTEYLDSNVFIDLSSDNEIINSGNNTFIHLLNSKIVDTHGINGLQGVAPTIGTGSLMLMSCFDNFDGNSFPTRPNIIIENRALIQE